MMVNRTFGKSRGAFSLIELLVVVAIIGTLLGILLPSLARVRTQARQAQCLGNMRVILQAATMFAQENDRALPMPNWLSMEGTPGTRGWLYTSPINTAATDATQVSTGVLWPYMGGTPNVFDPKIATFYRCPMDDGAPLGPSNRMTSYLNNGATAAFGRHAPFRFDRMPATAIWFWEAGESGWNDGSSYPAEGESRRHVIGCCVGAFDGSAYWWAHSEYVLEQSRSPGRLWCCPDTANGH